MAQKSPFEEKQVRDFVEWLKKGEDATLKSRPDMLGLPSRPGGKPDYVFEDKSGQMYVVEVTQLLGPKLRSLEKFALKTICKKVEAEISLPGTFLLEIEKESLTSDSIPEEVARQTADEIMALAKDGRLQDHQPLNTPGFTLGRVEQAGSRLVPWITAQALPYNLTTADPIAQELEGIFNEATLEANGKMEGFTGYRILLLDISQCGLDWELHAQAFRDGRGVLLVWADNISHELANLDAIYLIPGLRVVQPPDMRLVLAGHNYVGAPSGYYPCIWQRPAI